MQDQTVPVSPVEDAPQRTEITLRLRDVEVSALRWGAAYRAVTFDDMAEDAREPVGDRELSRLEAAGMRALVAALSEPGETITWSAHKLNRAAGTALEEGYPLDAGLDVIEGAASILRRLDT
jgi:hypothetical protein